VARRWESYLVGSLLILVAFLLVIYLEAPSFRQNLPALFLLGFGIILVILAALKAIAPTQYEMPAVPTLVYGLLAIVIGALWIISPMREDAAIILLIVVLAISGAYFLARTRLKPTRA
jgi:uncharacterized membrane protein HdeD (DUF308 family)